jgi:uncharacterized membrane protein
MDKKINLGEAFSFAWQEFRRRFVFFTGAAAVILAINILPSLLFDRGDTGAGIVEFIMSLVSLALALGLIQMAIKVVRNQEPVFNDFNEGFRKFWHALLAYILYGLALLIPTILIVAGSFLGFLEFLSMVGDGGNLDGLLIISLILIIAGIVAGIYLVLRFLLFQFAIIGDDYKPLDSLKRSAELTKGVKWSLLGFVILAALLNILGAIPFGLGLLITIPLTVIAQAHIYQQLVKQSVIDVSNKGEQIQS